AQQGYKGATEIRAMKPYYVAEEYHLDYYMKKGTLPYCQSHKKIF
ncbi:peptide-methionine (S)-S-oxide reductase, partial [Francisella tularensis]